MYIEIEKFFKKLKDIFNNRTDPPNSELFDSSSVTLFSILMTKLCTFLVQKNFFVDYRGRSSISLVLCSLALALKFATLSDLKSSFFFDGLVSELELFLGVVNVLIGGEDCKVEFGNKPSIKYKSIKHNLFLFFLLLAPNGA